MQQVRSASRAGGVFLEPQRCPPSYTPTSKILALTLTQLSEPGLTWVMTFQPQNGGGGGDEARGWGPHTQAWSPQVTLRLTCACSCCFCICPSNSLVAFKASTDIFCLFTCSNQEIHTAQCKSPRELLPASSFPPCHRPVTFGGLLVLDEECM